MLTVAVPTLNRQQVLIATLRQIMAHEPPPTEILVLDQTKEYPPSIVEILETWHIEGKIRWLRLPMPSVTKAMNQALIAARHEIVLFIDDDVVPEPGMLAAHLAAHSEIGAELIAGRIIQPWQEGLDFASDDHFHFAVLEPQWVDSFIGCNFSIRKEVALRLGGFDENFVRVAYNFEVEFAHRLRSNDYQIYFEPRACLHHLKSPSGGTRTMGDHLTTWNPSHAVGAYYCTIRTTVGWHRCSAMLRRFLSSVVTRHHLRRPWWIPATLLAELLGVIWALALAYRGPRYLPERAAQ